MKFRCPWCEGNEIYIRYHDTEWGVPAFDDRKQFEFLVLESAQAGLSWLTILKKRENYRAAYDNFDPEKVARYSATERQRLITDKGIVRNGRKIDASIRNAQNFLAVQEEFGSFSTYLWRFVDGSPVVNRWKTLEEVPAATPLAEQISKDLKQRGFTFLGPVIIYSHLQATGLVNDHLIDCFRYNEIVGAYS